MKVKEMTPSLPAALKHEIEKEPPRTDSVPGFLIGVDQVIENQPRLSQTIASMHTGIAPVSPCMVVSPDDVTALVSSPEALDLIKSVTIEVAKQIHPYVKTGVEGIWLVYRAHKLYDDWKRPDRDNTAFLFKAAGFAMGTANVVGGVYPQLKIADSWANGVNFLVKSGGAIYSGKTLPINEMILSSDKRLALPLKFLKVAGVALDPDPNYVSMTARPLTGKVVSPISKTL